MADTPPQQPNAPCYHVCLVVPDLEGSALTGAHVTTPVTYAGAFMYATRAEGPDAKPLVRHEKPIALPWRHFNIVRTGL